MNNQRATTTAARASSTKGASVRARGASASGDGSSLLDGALAEGMLDAAAMEQTERLRAVIGKLSRRLRATRAGVGLTPSQISVLFRVVREETMSVTSLAAAEGLNVTMLSRIAAQLCRAGLIRREEDPLDGRMVVLLPTAAGRRLRDRIHRERTEALGHYVQLLGPRQRKTLWAALPVLEALAEQLPEGRA